MINIKVNNRCVENKKIVKCPVCGKRMTVVVEREYLEHDDSTLTSLTTYMCDHACRTRVKCKEVMTLTSIDIVEVIDKENKQSKFIVEMLAKKKR